MCCGKNRELLKQSLVKSEPMPKTGTAQMDTRAGASEAFATPAPRSHGRELVFEFRGSNPFIAIGGVTGRRYHFAGPGARVQVDVRERELLAMIEGLVEVEEVAV